MKSRPRLMAFDLDGTLAESKQRLSDEMAELLAQLLDKMPVAIMSGAGFAQFEIQFLTVLPPHTHFERLYLFPTNAAQCYIYERGAWHPHYDHSFDPFQRARILQALKEALAETGQSEPPGEIWGERVEDRGAQITFSALGQEAPLEAKEQYHRLHEDARDNLRVALTRRLPDFSVSEGGLTTVQINPKGNTKAYGIRQLIKLTGVSVSEMLYVGDALGEGGNDAVVKETGIRTVEVFGPAETAEVIREILSPEGEKAKYITEEV